jgi:anaerobic glycerol-3-phosphate dehydrogenase
MWASKNLDNVVRSTADEYKAIGIILTEGNNNRILGKRTVDRMLADLPDGKPGLQVLSVCHNLIRTLPALPYDPVRTEDVDTNAEDHAYDALRMGLTNVMRSSAPRQKSNYQSVVMQDSSIF